MNITLAQLWVIMDTLSGSSAIVDGGNIFKFTAETRKAVEKELLSQMSRVAISMDVKEQ